MYTDTIDLAALAKRLAQVRTNYGESIDLPDLGPTAFATLLGVPAHSYESYERGINAPTADFLIALRNKTQISIDWLLNPNQSASP